MTIEPDTKDWTWVLQRPCAECGFDASGVTRESLPESIASNASRWQEVLRRDRVAERPSPGVWSPLEYACHVRDVHRLFRERVLLMLAEEDPVFENWDQDRTAVEDDYRSQDPAVVSAALAQAAGLVSRTYAAVREEQWERRGTRDNGSTFTVESLGKYHLHDAEHHLVDVRG